MAATSEHVCDCGRLMDKCLEQFGWRYKSPELMQQHQAEVIDWQAFLAANWPEWDACGECGARKEPGSDYCSDNTCLESRAYESYCEGGENR